jgi:hypothetical protein
MKKISLVVLSFSFFFNVFSQTIDVAKTKEIVSTYSKQLGLSENDIKNYIVSSSYKSDGIQYIYLLQSYKGLPVRNQMKVISIRDNALLSISGSFIVELEKLVSTQSTTASLKASDAVNAAFASEKLPVLNVGLNRQTDNHKFDFGQPLNVTEKVTGELMWLPIDSAGKIRSVQLIWTVVVAPKGTADIWQIFVNATNGKILGKQNFTVSENFVNNKNNVEKTLVQNKIENQTKNLLGKFDGIFSPTSTTALAGASYLVIPYPAESPIHPGGTAALRTNPWTAAVGNASTLGWHSDGVTDYTITRGNNAWATEDRAATDFNLGLPATSTTSPNPLTFNFPPNYSINPTNATGFQQFAITNLFYWNNILHDISYQYGFTEPAGNFQKNNLGRGGSGDDDVIALAQSGTGTNNANFSTPVDGGRPRMRMYLFDAEGANLKCQVNSPSTFVGNYFIAESGFSTANKLQNIGLVTAQVAWFDDATGTAHVACGTSATSIVGKIALINRGTCTYVTKVLAAQAAGAVGVIMINNVAGAPVIMGGTDNTITIPAVMLSQADGALFAAQLANNLNVTLSGTYLDSDLDNGIVAHEYGHGISTRLTGGPNNSSCLGSNAPANNYCGNTRENGSEGWSDYYALMVTTNWATTQLTDGAISRTIGTYANDGTLTGAGFRIKPYSTDLSINNETYANVGDATYCGGIHNIGEVWCTAIWEMTWGIIQQENFINPNLYDYSPTGNGGNIIAMKLVTEGLKLQPCSPGFVDQRDAILAADRSLYAGRHACTIWTAFAKRGLGYGANQGSSNSVNDQTPSSALPPAPTIGTQPLDASVAVGSNATFTANAGTDINLIYNWQVSTDGGTTWNNITPATITPTLTLTAVTSGMNGYKYRAQIFIGCAITTTTVVTLTILPVITSFTPASGAPGTLVTITGTNLNGLSAFTIGGVSGIVVSNTGATLVGMVMPGAATGTVAVTTPAGSATSAGTFTVQNTPFPIAQQGTKLAASNPLLTPGQGWSVALSADGKTALVGGYYDNNGAGATWVYTRTGNTWAQQQKLIGTGAGVNAWQGFSVALSADGNTAIVGGVIDNSAWVFTRSGGTWAQQGPKLVGSDRVGNAWFGKSVSLSADGNTAIVGGYWDNANTGAAWVFIRSGSTWAQQGTKLVGIGAVGAAGQGHSVSLSADGNIAAIGGAYDDTNKGATWIFTRSGNTWVQKKLVVLGVGATKQGQSVSLSADATTLMIGGVNATSNVSNAWVYTRSGSTWTQQGTTIAGSDAVGTAANGTNVTLSADGNTAMMGSVSDNGNRGAAWVFTRSGNAYTQKGKKLVALGTVGTTLYMGRSVALSADGTNMLVGADGDDTNKGATWSYAIGVTYDGNGNTGGTVPASQLETIGSSVTLATNSGALVKTGNTFAGWNTLANGTGTSYTEAEVITFNGSLPLYAQWTVGTLPVNFISITASRKTTNVQVNFKVGNEINIHHYEVERSVDGTNYSRVGNVAAAGITDYSFLDVNAPTTNLFYRVKSVENAGEGKYSAVAKLSAEKTTPGYEVAPNPIVGSEINVQFKNQLAGKYQLKLFNNAGQQKQRTEVIHVGGNGTQTIQIPSGLARGAYQLEISSAGKTSSTVSIFINNK